MKNILFLTKDAFCKAYLPCYGSKYWAGKTPNLDELAAKGTKFNNFITAAPSSNMSYLSMFTMSYPYTLPIKDYRPLPDDFKVYSLFDKANDLGYDTHILWDEAWGRIDVKFSKCYGKKTVFHNMPNFRQPVGCKYPHDKLIYDSAKAEEGLNELKKELLEITSSEKPVFLWCHLPHVLKGCISYGFDIDLYDRYIGVFREFFDDDNIFLSADHGNMNGLKGILCYGFDVYEPAINIPFIAPRIGNLSEYDTPVSNIDVFELIFNRNIPQREYVISDSAYYGQLRRKTAIIYGKYRYIYNKYDNTEELYDVEWDPCQQFNFISDNYVDDSRGAISPAIDYYFYPWWDNLPEIRIKVREIKNSIWRQEEGKDLVISKIRKNKYLRAVLSPVLRWWLKRMR